jgi:hypothetical protein
MGNGRRLWKWGSVVELFEFWDYKVTRHENGAGGLFAGYVDMLLKLKQEASVYPTFVQSEEAMD